jgi:hypothetical protein
MEHNIDCKGFIEALNKDAVRSQALWSKILDWLNLTITQLICIVCAKVAIKQAFVYEYCRFFVEPACSENYCVRPLVCVCVRPSGFFRPITLTCIAKCVYIDEPHNGA